MSKSCVRLRESCSCESFIPSGTAVACHALLGELETVNSPRTSLEELLTCEPIPEPSASA